MHICTLRWKSSLTTLFLFAAVMLLASQIKAATIDVTLGGNFCNSSEGIAGVCSSRVNATTVTFDGLVSSTSSPYVDDIATYSWSGDFSPFVKGSASGQYAAPGADKGGFWADATTYLTVGSPRLPSRVTIDFSKPIDYFGLYMGSPDDYNHMQFQFFGTNLATTLSGSALLGPSNGSWATAGFINFDFSGGAVSRIVLTSDSAAFETDNHAFAVATPEPLSMLLLGSGLVGLGAWGRRRNRKR